MAVSVAPKGLAPRGRRLWKAILETNDLDPAQTVMLEEACRTADRLEKLDELLRGEVDSWASLVADIHGDDTYELKIDGALSESRQQQNILKQLLAALRLPDEASGKRPQQRGGARGAYKPTAATGAKVSSLDRARAAREA